MVFVYRIPVETPVKTPVPDKVEPVRRLNPDTLCPDQTEKVIEIVQDILAGL